MTSQEMTDLKALVGAMDKKLDRALLTGQDFRTWRRGHEERHGRECADHAKRIVAVEKQVRKIRALDWRILLAGLAGGGSSVGAQKALAALSAAFGWGG